MVSPEPGDPARIAGPPHITLRAVVLVPRPSRGNAAKEDFANLDRDEILLELRRPIDRKTRFIVPAGIFLIVFCFALAALAEYAHRFMHTRRVGPVTFAYLFALSQFFMAWIIAALFVRAANIFGHDKEASHEDPHHPQETYQNHHP